MDFGNGEGDENIYISNYDTVTTDNLNCDFF